MIDWEAVSAVASALGTLGVLVTLLYLAKQIKDNSKLLATSIYESAMSGFNDLQHLIASDADVARIAQHFFIEGGQELSQLDRMRANFAIRFYVNHLYKLHRLHELRILPEKEWLNTASEAKQAMRATALMRQFVENNHYYDDLWKELEKHENRVMTEFVPARGDSK